MCEASHLARSVKPFFILEACAPQKAVGRVVAPEPSPTGRWGPESWDTRQCRSPPQQRGEARSYRTCDSIGALLGREARSVAMGHMAASKPASVGRCGPGLQDA
jgi:hypothetical protein